jgi:hypothetical protein
MTPVARQGGSPSVPASRLEQGAKKTNNEPPLVLTWALLSARATICMWFAQSIFSCLHNLPVNVLMKGVNLAFLSPVGKSFF